MLIHYEGGLHMTKYREILRLTALGLSLRDIEKSLKVSRKTIVKVQKRADELSLSGPLDESLTDAELEQRMFPKDLSPKSTKRMPDFDYIRKELLKNGVNKKLLWTEYLEECRQSGDEPLMYSQFCYYIQQDEQKRRATMHIKNGATGIARMFGLSETLIGLTIVALGTSLPELVTSIVAARKGQNEIAMGNVIGSNLFNILLILGVSSVITPIPVQATSIIDCLFLIAISVVFYLPARKGKLGRLPGAVMAAMYVAYTADLIMR